MTTHFPSLFCRGVTLTGGLSRRCGTTSAAAAGPAAEAGLCRRPDGVLRRALRSEWQSREAVKP